MKLPYFLTWVGSLTALTALSAQAQMLQTSQSTMDQSNGQVYTVATGDLLETSASIDTARSSDLSIFQRESQTGASALTDGTFGIAGDANFNATTTATAGANTTLTFQLNLTGHATGYDISGITTYAGWSTGRYGQAYDVSVLYVGDTNFSHVASVAYGPATGEAGYPDGATQVGTMVGLTGLLTGVSEIQFNFNAAPGNPAEDFSGYREIDVFAAAVPEPSTYLLMGMGLLGLVVAFRQRRLSVNS